MYGVVGKIPMTGFSGRLNELRAAACRKQLPRRKKKVGKPEMAGTRFSGTTESAAWW